jgi:hypothetical protein
MACKHLTTTEAFRIGPDGKQTPEVGHLCVWADAHPDRFIDAPRWITNPALASILIRPERDCVGCPGYEGKDG